MGYRKRHTALSSSHSALDAGSHEKNVTTDEILNQVQDDYYRTFPEIPDPTFVQEHSLVRDDTHGVQHDVRTKWPRALCSLTMTLLFLLSALAPFSSQASYIYKNFFITEKSLTFTNNTGKEHCRGAIPYPILTHEDDEEISKINDNILNFVQSYAICNQDKASSYSVSFDLLPGNADAFSIIWTTKKDGTIYRLDALNFYIQTAELIEIEDVFHPLRESAIREIIKLSDGHLKPGDSWERFQEMVTERKIQFYIKDGKWRMVFNPTADSRQMIDIEVPEYLLWNEGHNVD